MKFNCGEDGRERWDRQKQWHRFFAILPRRVASHDCRCFEWVERKLSCDGWGINADYRAITKERP